MNQTCAYTLPDSVSFAGTEILCDIIGNGSHHSVIYKHGKLICFGSSRISGNGSSAKGIYHRLHSKLSDTHDRHLESHRKTCFQMQSNHSFGVMEILTVQMQNRELFQTDDQTEQSREKLRKNRSPGSSGNTHMKRHNKQNIKKNI